MTRERMSAAEYVTLEQITGAMGVALKTIPSKQRALSERALNLYIDALVAELKRMGLK